MSSLLLQGGWDCLAKVCAVLLILSAGTKLKHLPGWAGRILYHGKAGALCIFNVIAQILCTHTHKQHELCAGPESGFNLIIALCTLCFLNTQNPSIAKC